MRPFETLSELDQKRIKNYLSEFAYNDVTTGEQRASLEHILRFWDRAKQDLFDKFGGQLIHSKTVRFEEGVDQLCEKIDHWLCNDQKNHQFLESCINAIAPDCEWGCENYWNIRQSLSHWSLALNHVNPDEDFTIKLGDNKTFKVESKKTKTIRLLRKIATAYNIEGIEDFAIKHSQCLNQKTLEGELCLSIHPLDYMTMSDNASNWCSCMSWAHGGEYRQGTVEMMNSWCVVVAYLKGDGYFDYGWGDESRQWNNKKWRQLFLVNKDFILSVKGYPYHNENLIKETIKYIAETIGWGEVKIHPFEHDCDNNYDGCRVYIRTDTYAMYNDFDSTDHFIALNPEYDKESLVNDDYVYSGVSECMYCGTEEDFCGDDCESNLVCGNCGNYTYCAHCGDRIYEDACWIDDVAYCEWCYGEHTRDCIITGERYDEGDIITLYLSASNSKEEIVVPNCPSELATIEVGIYVWSDYSHDWKKYFKEDPAIFYSGWCPRKFFVTPEMCTEDGLLLFGYDSATIKDYMVAEAA